MSLIWLLTMGFYGISQGYAQIPALFWLLLIPMAMQDFYDIHSRK